MIHSYSDFSKKKNNFFSTHSWCKSEFIEHKISYEVLIDILIKFIRFSQFIYTSILQEFAVRARWTSGDRTRWPASARSKMTRASPPRSTLSLTCSLSRLESYKFSHFVICLDSIIGCSFLTVTWCAKSLGWKGLLSETLFEDSKSLFSFEFIIQ